MASGNVAGRASGGRAAIAATGTSGNVSVAAGGQAFLGTLSAIGTTAISGASIDVATTADLTLANAVTTTGDLLLATSGTLTAGTLSSGDLIGLSAGKDLSVGATSAAGTIAMLAQTGSISAGTASTQGGFAALASGNIALSSVTTGTGSNGFVYLANSSMLGLVGNDPNLPLLRAATPVRAGGAISISGNIVTGQFNAASGAAFTAAGLNAASGITVDSGGLASFNGAVVAPSIAIGSLDLTIGSSATIGNSATSGLKLTSGATQTTIGGSGSATGYLLDNAEAGRLRAAQIDIAATGGITLAALNLTGSGSSTGNLVGSNARFQVQTPGNVRVTASVDLSNAAATDALNIIAGNRFEIATGTGQIRLLGADSKPSGIAAITANNIAVAQASLLDQIAANNRFSGRDAALSAAQTGSGVKAEGYLQAGTLAFTVGDTLLIQNSGTDTTFGGFTVGTGGVQIAALGSGNTPIDTTIYGRSIDATGTIVADSTVRSSISVAVPAAARLSATSAINGCALATASCTMLIGDKPVTVVAQTQVTTITASVQAAVSGGSTTGGGTTSSSSSSSSGGDSGGGSSGGGGGGDSGGGGASGGDEGGDDSGGGGEKSSAGGGNAAGAMHGNLLIDTNNIGSTQQQIDTPVTSSGNTSLWSGEDGLSDIGPTGVNP